MVDDTDSRRKLRTPIASFQNSLEAPHLLSSKRRERSLPLEPWYGRVSRISTFIIIPTVAFYAVFLYDWGPHDHVFSEPQRWFRQKMDSFNRLSPGERKLTEQSAKIEDRK